MALLKENNNKLTSKKIIYLIHRKGEASILIDFFISLASGGR